jgi:hypothetical protein
MKICSLGSMQRALSLLLIAVLLVVAVAEEETSSTEPTATTTAPAEKVETDTFNAKDHTDWGSYYDPKNIFCGKYGERTKGGGRVGRLTRTAMGSAYTQDCLLHCQSRNWCLTIVSLVPLVSLLQIATKFWDLTMKTMARKNRLPKRLPNDTEPCHVNGIPTNPNARMPRNDLWYDFYGCVSPAPFNGAGISRSSNIRACTHSLAIFRSVPHPNFLENRQGL